MRSHSWQISPGTKSPPGRKSVDRPDTPGGSSRSTGYSELDLSERLVEDEGIGDHRHGHSPRLPSLVVRLAKNARNLRAELTSICMSAREVFCREPYAIL